MPSNSLPLWTDLCKPVVKILRKGNPEQLWAGEFNTPTSFESKKHDA